MSEIRHHKSYHTFYNFGITLHFPRLSICNNNFCVLQKSFENDNKLLNKRQRKKPERFWRNKRNETNSHFHTPKEISNNILCGINTNIHYCQVSFFCFRIKQIHYQQSFKCLLIKKLQKSNVPDTPCSNKTCYMIFLYFFISEMLFFCFFRNGNC